MAIIVTREKHDARQGRYVARIDGLDGEAELTFNWRCEHLLSANHTGTPDELRGKGLAMALVERLIADARAEDFKIIPMCAFVRAKFADHPDWADVMSVGPGELPHLKLR